MNFIRSLVAVLLMLPIMSSAYAQGELSKKTKLYVGTGQANNGVVTTNKLHLSDTTEEIGYTIDDASAVPPSQFTEAFVGNDQPNNGVVTRDSNHKGGSTRPIGFVSKKPIPGGTKLYVGTGPENGVVTTSTKHGGATSDFFGYALPK